MRLEETKKALNKFAKYIVQQSKSNLTREKKNVTKNLYNSIDLLFSMEDYGAFQDLGVSGTKTKYNTPYSYTTKMPPSKAFSQWVVRKGLKGTRDKAGKFIKRKSLQYLVARGIFEHGIKPSLFFTKPFQRAFKYIPNELRDAFIFDIEQDKMFFPENMNKN